MGKIINKNGIKTSLGIDPNGAMQKFFVAECVRRMDKYVPMDEGNLREKITIGKNYVDYNVPYASVQYEGYIKGTKITKYTTPNTYPHWDKKMWSAEGDLVIKTIKERFRL